MINYVELFRKYLSQLNMTPPVIAAIEKSTEIRHYSKGDLLLKMGERSEYICLILEGLVRGYYLDEEGKEITKCFSKEFDWCCTYNYFSKGASTFYIEAIEDLTVARITVQSLEKLFMQFPKLDEVKNEKLIDVLMASERRAFSLNNMEARERYIEFSKANPEIVKRAKQEYIASYLGVTPSSLSRTKRTL